MNSGYVTIYGEKKIKWSICSCLPIWDIRGKCCYPYHFLKPLRNRMFTLKKIVKYIEVYINFIGEEKMLFIYYPKCSTCQKAKKWLDEHNINYTERHIVETNPTYDELKEWYHKGGLPLKKFFNTSGLVYKEMQLKDKLPQMSEEEQLKLLATNGMLVKRPLIVEEDMVLIGFKEAEWNEKLN